jgi:acetyl-CoA carboxylase biotin carboxylase subunit
MFEKILIANRGEIALRINRACKEMGISTVAVHSTADADAMHVRLADESVCIGPPASAQSYLNIPAIIAACEITGAEAIHPGYGFLSENAKFADIVKEHGITFIGPTPEHIRMMGDKITAIQAVKAVGIPTVPGSGGAVGDGENALRSARAIGYPVLIKATAGGGGRGMKVALSEADLPLALSTARGEAKAAFGNDQVYMEKYLQHPRHIEIQVLADAMGNVIHLGERDCSLQRRHQKVWEEAGSPALNAAQRDEIGGVVTRALKKLGYLGAGTIEFLFEDGQFYFIEMNTRLQVEHPVSELLTGIDIAVWQLRIAGGERLPATGLAPLVGHAIEFRINCEDPRRGFMPAAGTVSRFRPPLGAGVRVDTHAYEGYRVPPFYDSLLAKVIVHGGDREQAMARARRALGELEIEGVATTRELFLEILDEPRFGSGRYTTAYLDDARDALPSLAEQVA